MIDHSKPTERQKEFLDYIKGFTKENGIAPGYKEMVEHFKIGRSGVQRNLQPLMKKGYLGRTVGMTRSWKILKKY